MTQSELERLAVLETNMDNLLALTARIDSKLDHVIECKAERVTVSTLQTKVEAHEKALNTWRGSFNVVRWVGPIAGAIVSGVVVSLIMHALYS